jgi:hypothetical protein
METYNSQLRLLREELSKQEKLSHDGSTVISVHVPTPQQLRQQLQMDCEKEIALNTQLVAHLLGILKELDIPQSGNNTSLSSFSLSSPLTPLQMEQVRSRFCIANLRLKYMAHQILAQIAEYETSFQYFPSHSSTHKRASPTDSTSTSVKRMYQQE